MPHDSDDDDGIIGTPFEPLEANEIVARKPQVDQTVRDERGRRRFHGAFTGGFSAGHWNTVGSAEGFTPKIFLSSRQNKFDKSSLRANPEDYMDQEDFGAFGIAPKKIHTRDDFAENFSFAGLRGDTQMTFDDVIRSVFQPSKESIGQRLFRKMKKMAKLEQKSQSKFKLFESQVKESDVSKAESYFNQNQLFKENNHGLGFIGINSQTGNLLFSSEGPNVNSEWKDNNQMIMATMSSGRRLKISGEAFGYGALDEEDDFNVYSRDDMFQYDFEIGKNKEKKKKNKFQFSNSADFIQLDGFTKSKNSKCDVFSKLKNKYKTPELPKGWRPKIEKTVQKDFFASSTKKSRWDSGNLSFPAHSNQAKMPSVSEPQKVLNANLRAVILGEEAQHCTGFAKQKSAELDFDKNFEKSKSVAESQTAAIVRQTPLSGYFASKFTRTADSKDTHEQPLSAGLNTFEEFSTKSGLEIKPRIEINKNNQFQAKENKKIIEVTYEWHPHKILCKRFGVPNPYPQYPDVVGVILMKSDDKSQNMIMLEKVAQKNNKKNSKNSIFSDLNDQDFHPLGFINSSKVEQVDLIKNEKSAAKASFREESFTSIPSTCDKACENNTENESKSRPPISLFKSIFASDEEVDDEQENMEKFDDNKKVQSCEKNDSQENDDAKSRQNSRSIPSKGIFDDLNFDCLENFDPRVEPSKNDLENFSENVNEEKTIEDDDNDDCYGPAMPPLEIQPLLTPLSASKNGHRKKRRNGKSHHHKKDRGKKKSHRSKKRRKQSSSSSSSSEDSSNEDEISTDRFVQLIKQIKR